MYIEELVIDNYITQVQQWEAMPEESQWEEPYPEMPEIAQMYHEQGELWLESSEQQETAIAPDILS